MRNKSIYIGKDELIVGERGPAPKATPTYPEITVHSLQDLEILNSREKVWFRVDEETKKAFADTIIPFWTGRSNRDRMMEAMTTEWHDAYEAGIFTEFMEQRAPGHTVAGYKIFQKGMLDIMQDVDQSMEQLDFVNDPQAYDKKEELKAMKIAANALIIFANRHADKLEELATTENDAHRKAELIKMAQVCRRVPAHAPQTFHEVLQHYWFVHLGVVTELNPWDSFNPGRLDQHLSSADGVDDGRAADLGEPGPRAALSAFIKIGVTVDDVAGHQPAFFPSAPCPYAGFEAVRLGVHPHGEHQAAPRHRAKVVVFCTGSQGAAVSASAHLFPSLGQ